MAQVTVKDPSISAGNYDYLEEALAASETDILISGTWDNDDTTAASIDVADTVIATDASSRHDGVPAASPSYYRLRNSAAAHCITVNATGAIIDGIEIRQANTGNSREGIRVGGDFTVTVRDCMIYVTAHNVDQDGIYIGNNDATVNVENCFIFGWARCGIHYQNFAGTSTGTINCNSCTIWNCGENAQASNEGAGGIGIESTAGSTININVFNTIAVGNTTGTNAEDFSESADAGGTENWDIHDSISSDASITARDSGKVNCDESRTPTDTASPGEGDWVIFEDITGAMTAVNLKITDGAENDAHQNHSTSSGAGMDMPPNDILDNPRSAAYDCGAHEKSTSSPPATRRVMVVS